MKPTNSGNTKKKHSAKFSMRGIHTIDDLLQSVDCRYTLDKFIANRLPNAEAIIILHRDKDGNVGLCFGGTNDYMIVMGMLNAGTFLINMQASDG